MRWITRERPKIDRVACPWLIARFIDTEAEFIFVPPDEVIEEAQKLDATPYDVHGVELTHDGEFCSFHAGDDHAVLRDGFIVYDALYRWLKFCRGEKHLWFPPTSKPATAT
jgi:hypothetical protein